MLAVVDRGLREPLDRTDEIVERLRSSGETRERSDGEKGQ